MKMPTNFDEEVAAINELYNLDDTIKSILMEFHKYPTIHYIDELCDTLSFIDGCDTDDVVATVNWLLGEGILYIYKYDEKNGPALLLDEKF